MSMLPRRVGLGIAMVVLQGFSTYVQYGGNVLTFLEHAKVRQKSSSLVLSTGFTGLTE